jgi:nitrate/TMAO reductase-like tetraheme cytochrome c subunit
MSLSRTVLNSIKVAVLASSFIFAFGAPVFAQDDLSDNSVCLDCHSDADHTALDNLDRPQVHNPAGGFFVEAHSEFSCIDCHTYIENLEHDQTAPDMSVDCLECHDEVPAKQ